jgi:hypothetical protein
MKAGKIPLHSTVSIKITGQLKKYIDDLVNTGNIKCGYSFWVHGHYRNLTAPFYKAKKGQRIFIPPFVKGMGNLIEKNYEVMGMGK